MRKGDPPTRCCARSCRWLTRIASSPGFGSDAVGDLDASAGGGVLHKYEVARCSVGRRGSCAVHLPLLLPPAFPYDAENCRERTSGADAIAYLRDRSDVSELILSGGDPWSLATQQAGRAHGGAARRSARASRARAHAPARGAAEPRR
jgi:L-lysine 2,3-aminomutase